jgi:deoxyribodipyrimidine photolyase
VVDAALANNAANWQWLAGCGADAAPFFRIFNPVLQGAKFDPEGFSRLVDLQRGSLEGGKPGP